MKKNYPIISAIAFSVLILCVIIFFSVLSGRITRVYPQSSPGYVDISDFNFDNVAHISIPSFDYYKNELYSHEDFARGNVKIEPSTPNSGGFDTGNYGTFRVVIKLPTSGDVYGLRTLSSAYSQRFFIDGKEYPAFGIDNESVETAVPLIKPYTVYFAPRSNEVEIIIQQTAFNHGGSGELFELDIGSQEKVMERTTMSQERGELLVGCALMAFLFFTGMFFFFYKRRDFLWFALICLMYAIHKIILDKKVYALLFPNVSLSVTICLDYLAIIVMVMSILLYISNVFEGAIFKIIVRVFGAVCALYAATILISPPIVYTQYMSIFEIFSAATGVYIAAAIIYNLLRKKDNRSLENFLVLAGALVYYLLSIANIQFNNANMYTLLLGTSETAVLVLISVNMLALVLRFSRIEIELGKARRNELEMQETNMLLDRMSRLKSDMLANISHEMRTPLTVMSSYAGLTSMEIRRGAVNEKTLEHLVIIKQEAVRLANLVEQLKDVSLEKQRQVALSIVDAAALLRRAADFCESICQKNRNEIYIDEGIGNIALRVNSESIFQTLINLIINSNRHTKDGTILLNVQPESGTEFAVVSVSDDGEGISPRLLPEIFQRGISGDGSSGLGLAISKEIIEEHGGKIWIESESGKGTVVRFTLPMSEGEEKDEKVDDSDR